jgi:hypothetical protein
LVIGNAAALPGTGRVVCVSCFKKLTGALPLPPAISGVSGELARSFGVMLAPNACKTPAWPAPLPVPYPTVGAITTPPPATKTKPAAPPITTTGAITSTKGLEPGTMKEVATFNVMPTYVVYAGKWQHAGKWY